jgi:hypothetical protein
MKKIMLSLLVLVSVVGTKVGAMQPQEQLLQSALAQIQTLPVAGAQAQVAQVQVAQNLITQVNKDALISLVSKQIKDMQYARTKRASLIKWTRRAVIVAAIAFTAYSIYNPDRSMEFAKSLHTASKNGFGYLKYVWMNSPKLMHKAADTCTAPFVRFGKIVADYADRVAKSFSYTTSCLGDGSTCKPQEYFVNKAQEKFDAASIVAKIAVEKAETARTELQKLEVCDSWWACLNRFFLVGMYK